MGGGRVVGSGVPSSWKYNVPVITVAVLGTILSVTAWAFEESRLTDQANAIAAEQVTVTAQRASLSLGELRGAMTSFQGFFATQAQPTDAAFQTYARQVTDLNEDVTAVVWAPEASSSTSLPVEFVHPPSQTSVWRGVDLQTLPSLDRAIVEAKETGVTHVEEVAAGPRDDGSQLMVVTPVYEGGTPATTTARTEQFTGIAAASLPVMSWMDSAALDSEASQTALTLLRVEGDEAQPVWTNGAQPIGENRSNRATESVLRLSGDEEYVLTGEPTAELVAAQGTWRPWITLVVGLLITAGLTLLLWRWLGARRIRRTADELKKATNRLLFLAERDALTGLPHRDGLLSWLDAWDERNPERPLGLLFIDLDAFKEVNTAWGHPTGDVVLSQIGHRLAVFADGEDCVVARLGGDEFVVVRALDRGSLDGLATMVQTVISEPVSVGDRDIQLTSSMGIAIRPEDGRTLDTLLTNADIAVRAAKLEPNDSVVHYDPVMAAQGAARRNLAATMRLALRHPDEHFFLQYQPQVDMRTGSLVGAEALVRWRDESGNLVSPGDFVPLACEYGLMSQLGWWVLERACDTVVEWRSCCEATISVNVDATQLVDGFSDVVASVMHRRGVNPEWVVLEVTESAAMRPEAEGELNRLRDLGVLLSIDDFGTGYSSLSRLADLPTHELKIDRTFVNGLGDSPESLEIVRTVVALANALEMQTLAEGVETTEQARILMQEGVHTAQGFLFAKPVSARQCQRLWQNGIPAVHEQGNR